MTYQPRVGDYGVVSTKGIVGFFIQLGTFSKENHAFLYVGHDAIIEATPRKGVVISPVTKYSNIVWNRHETLTVEQRKAIVTESLKHLGDPYFFRSFIVIGFRIMGLKLPRWITGDLSKSKGVICSELVTKCYRAVGITIEGHKPEYFVTPSDLTYRLLYL